MSDPNAMQSSQAAGRNWRLSRLTRRERRRLAVALLLSLLTHALLLSLTFDAQELGLPGLALPWRDRRIEVPELRVVLAPAQVTAAKSATPPVAKPLPPASTEPPVAVGPTLARSASPAAPPPPTTDAAVPMAEPTAQAVPQAIVATDEAAANAPSRPDGTVR